MARSLSNPCVPATLLGLYLWIQLASLVRTGEGAQCLNGFVGMNTLKQKAALIGSTRRREEIQLLFPWIRFTCSGTLTGWMFVGEDRGGGRDRNEYPELQIWRPNVLVGTRYSKVLGISGVPLSTRHPNVYEYNVFMSVQFRAGDVLGVHQPEGRKSRYNVLFQQRGGPTNYYDDREEDPLNSFDLEDDGVESDENDVPLVGVMISNPSCAMRFLDLNILIAKGSLIDGSSTDIVAREEQQRLYQNIAFGCTGTIDKWIFAAEDNDGGSAYPEVQMWSELGNTELFVKRDGVSLRLRRTESLNVYEYVPSSPIPFNPGDNLGLHQLSDSESAFTIYSQRNTGGTNLRSLNAEQPLTLLSGNIENHQTTENDLPLIRVEITVDCGSLENPANGRVSFTSTTGGSVAAYRCHSGYTLKGASERTCQPESGKWSGSASKCSLIVCEPLSDITNGTVTQPAQSTVGSVATYECDTGFTLDGDGRRICQSDSNWSGEVPVCNGIQCPELPPLNSSRVEVTVATPNTDYGTTAAYSCEEGFRLTGAEVLTCLDNAMWSESPPTCEWIDCGVPDPPENGHANFSAPANGINLGLVVTYSCLTGYTLTGDSQRVCMANSTWSGVLPTCEAIDCGKPHQIENGAVTFNHTTYGSMAVYTCYSGFVLVGEKARTCDIRGNWSEVVPLCKTPPAPTSSSSLGDKSQISPTSSTLPTRSTTGINPRGHHPSEGSTDTLNLIIGSVIALLLVIILLMTAIIVVVYVKRWRHKQDSESDTPLNGTHNSVDNPVYTGQTFPLRLWNRVAKGRHGTLHERPLMQETPCSTVQSKANSGSFRVDVHGSGGMTEGDDATYQDPIGCFDQPLVARPRPAAIDSAHYEMDSLYHHYEFPDVQVANEPHYEEASSTASQYEVPVSPYQVPSPSTKALYRNIYGTLQWGVFVPTEEQRFKLSSANNAQHLQVPGTPRDQKDFFEESETYWKPASDTASLYEQLARNKYREILRHQIQITEHLGSGQFGTVNKGLWQSPASTVDVAVKTLKPGLGEDDRIKFLQEAAINGQFQHPNVVKLHGVVTVGEPVMIVLELLKNGDLRDYLLKNRPAPGEMLPSDWSNLLLNFCKDIASGMDYLSRKCFVHRDLAARNILVADSKICKIGDFGMSRDLEDEHYYISHGGKIPVKWTAPEAVHYKKYSTASDVWSYGAVIFEIWSMGHKPFEGYTNPQTVKMIDIGFRLSPPPGCPRAIYSLMMQCWHPETSSRPSFTSILHSLSSPPSHLLGWSEEDKGAHPLAAVLGAPLEAGSNLFVGLQQSYTINDFDQ